MAARAPQVGNSESSRLRRRIQHREQRVPAKGGIALGKVPCAAQLRCAGAIARAGKRAFLSIHAALGHEWLIALHNHAHRQVRPDLGVDVDDHVRLRGNRIGASLRSSVFKQVGDADTGR